MGKKVYRTNPDTISLNMDEVMASPFGTFFPFKEELESSVRGSDSAGSGSLLSPVKHSKDRYMILWEGKANENMGRSKREVYALKGNLVINLVYDAKDNNCVFRREMRLRRPYIENLQDDLNGKNGFLDYVTLLSVFTSEMRYDSIRQSDSDCKPKIKVRVSEIPYHPKEYKKLSF